MLRPESTKGHSLSVATAAVLLFWIAMYLRSDPTAHGGNFFGNAIADWTGTLVMVLATKYMYEIGSKESKTPKRESSNQVIDFLKCHSLSIFLVITGAGWLLLYLHQEPDSRWGQVVGNLLSEWVQVLGLVLMTKYLAERGAKY